jgi:sensor domain CHASE-containing protein
MKNLLGVFFPVSVGREAHHFFMVPGESDSLSIQAAWSLWGQSLPAAAGGRKRWPLTEQVVGLAGGQVWQLDCLPTSTRQGFQML